MELNSIGDTQGVPVGFLVGALDVASDYGYHAETLLRKCNIPQQKLSDVGNRISAEQYYTVLDHLLERGDIQGLGLLQARAESFTDHGVIGTAFLSSENLYVAAEAAVKYQRLFGPVAESYLNIKPEDKTQNSAIMVFGQGRALRYRWSVENALASWASLIRQGLGEQAVFSSLRVSFSEPVYRGLYEEIFDCPIEFDHDANELCFASRLLECPFPSANAALFELCVGQCEKAWRNLLPGRRLIDQIEGIIISSVGSIPQLETIAARLCLSPRTLHRRLKDQGTSYRQIVENLRSRLASEYMGDTNLEPKRVAFLLRYSEPANFYHAFQRWFACTPLEYRRRRQQPGE